jgi:hypothetical protein
MGIVVRGNYPKVLVVGVIEKLGVEGLNPNLGISLSPHTL